MFKRKKTLLLALLPVLPLIYFLISRSAEAVELSVPFGKEAEIANPAQYIETLYQFAIGIGALLAMAQIVAGAIQRITSAGNASRIGDANKRILQAIYGLILLLAAILILNTISPNLTSLQLTPPSQPESSLTTTTAGIEAEIRRQHEDISKLVEAENKAKDLAAQVAEQEKKVAAARKAAAPPFDSDENKLELLKQELPLQKLQLELAKQNLAFNQEQFKKGDQYIALLQINYEQQSDPDVLNVIRGSINNQRAASKKIYDTLAGLNKEIKRLDYEINATGGETKALQGKIEEAKRFRVE